MNPTNVTKYWLKALVNTVFIKESLYIVGAKKRCLNNSETTTEERAEAKIEAMIARGEG